FVSYVAPVFWNLAMIATLVAGGAWLALGMRDLVVALAWGALAGGILQLGVQIPFLLGRLRGFRLSLGRGVPGVGEAVRNFGPVVAARGVVNLSGWVDLVLAAQLANGEVALLGYAQTFYVLPISLFGMSVAASELPELSRMRGEAERVVADRVSTALRRVSWFLVPSAVGYVLLGDAIVAALYETGSFGGAESLATWAVLGAYSLGLTASGSSRVLSSAFYALHDTRTPARIAYARVMVSAVLGLALMFPLDRFGIGHVHLGAAGLALGASVGAWMEFALLSRSLRARLGAHGAGAARLARLALAAVLAAAAGVGVQVVVPPAHPFVVALETLAAYGVVYVAASSLLGLGGPLRRGAA
ncbi:MAG: murein biosynthesis integral membrane protein MurJ, partial [Gemmatimonadetes bacterium]|nr:murein biosynthesis integral membrane protein MurJ [Gemmatimonadota bacterium]